MSDVLKLVVELLQLEDHNICPSQLHDVALAPLCPSRPRKHQPEMFKTSKTFGDFLFISGILNFKQEVVNQLVAALLTNERFAAEAQDLYRRLRRIHANVQAHVSQCTPLIMIGTDSMDRHELRARWIVNTVLDSFLEVGSSDGTPDEQGYDTFIVPGMLVEGMQGVNLSLKNHTTGRSMLFDNFTIEYCVLQYLDNLEDKAILTGMHTFMHGADFQAATKDTGTFILVELSTDSLEIDGLETDSHSTAVKAALLGQAMGESPIRYCVSDGQSWHFAYVQLQRMAVASSAGSHVVSDHNSS